MGTPLVSVIMPVYNSEKYIAEAIDSICSQSLSEWELIIVNDGSTDQTQAIINGFSDPRIILVTQENAGEASARNTALTFVTGKYLAFLDADDILQPEALLRLSEFLTNSPEYGAVYADGYIWNSHGETVGKLSDCRPDNYQGNILEPLVVSSIITAPCCFMVCADLLVKHHLSFDEQLVIGPDWYFYINVARIAQIGYLPIIVCCYRIHGDNISTTSGSARRTIDLLKIREKVLHYDWFGELSEETKRSFYLDLLVNLLRGSNKKQREVISSPQFNCLTDEIKAKLIYRVGITALIDGDKDHSTQCLQESLNIKGTIQGWTVLWLVLILGQGLTKRMVKAYQSFRKKRLPSSRRIVMNTLLGINNPRE